MSKFGDNNVSDSELGGLLKSSFSKWFKLIKLDANVKMTYSMNGVSGMLTSLESIIST